MLMLIPLSLLLALSFFVLVAMNKLTEKSLKIFGWTVCVLLWLSAAVIAVSACLFCSSKAYGGYGRIKGICPLPGARNSQPDPYHPWRDKPYHKGMFGDPHHGLMTDDSDDPFAGLSEDLKCPVAEGDTSSQEPATVPDAKK